MFETSSSCFETKRFVHDVGSYLGKTKLGLVNNTFIHNMVLTTFFIVRFNLVLLFLVPSEMELFTKLDKIRF